MGVFNFAGVNIELMKKLLDTLYETFLKSSGVITDSRLIIPDGLFFALKGDHFNGNNFAEMAIEKGALAAVVDDRKFINRKGFFVVNDVLTTLQQLAGYHRSHLKGSIIALTGSNGKTTTKELIRSVLSQKYKVVATEGNFNNHIGVPLTLLKMPLDLDFGIVEMGANHPGEIAELCKIAEPDFGLITNIGKAHLEGFGNLTGVLEAKTEMYHFLKSSKGKVFVNHDNKMLWAKARDMDAISYGTQKPAFCQAKITREFPHLSVQLFSDDEGKVVRSNLIGVYNFENILAAACVGKYFNVPTDSIAQGIEAYIPQNLRSQFIHTDNNDILLDAYNANPSSMQAAIKNFDRLDKTRKMLSLGEMAELGTAAKHEHQLLIEAITQKEFDEVWLLGENFRPLTGHSFRHFNSMTELIDFIKMHPPKNRNILVKGSRSNQMEKIIPYL